MRLYLINSPFTGKCMLSKGNRLCVTEIKKDKINSNMCSYVEKTIGRLNKSNIS